MNCKPGDLAIVNSSRYAENIGRIVEVISLAPGLFHTDSNGESFRIVTDENGPFWYVRCASKLRNTRNGQPHWGNEGLISDARLTPISGVPVHDEITDEATV